MLMVLRRLPKVEPQMQIRPLTSTKSGLRWGGLDYKLASNAGFGRFMPCWPDLQGYFQEFLTTTITTSTLTRTSRTFTPGASCVCVRSDPTLQISCSHAPKLPSKSTLRPPTRPALCPEVTHHPNQHQRLANFDAGSA